MDTTSSFVPLLMQVKNKNTELILSLVNKVNTSSPTDSDYEACTRKKTRLELVLLSLVVFGIEICYAAETAFVSPILQKIGVPVQFMTMVWCLSPILGFFTCPILGGLSDGCRSPLGRRRPFIIIYSIGILIGLILTGYGQVIGNFIWNDHKAHYGPNPYVITITIIGIILLDFNCDACQSPARAYLIDVSQASDHSIGLSTFTIMAGTGGSLGYLLGSVPWADIAYSKPNANESLPMIAIQSMNQEPTNHTNIPSYTTLTNDHKQVLFTFVAIIYIICAILSITSFKEIPFGQLKRKLMNKEPSEKCTVRYQQMNESDDEASHVSNENTIVPSSSSTKLDDPNQTSQDAPTEQECPMSSVQTLKYYLNSIVLMPSSLRWLCVTHCFCWMSLLCYSLYFTDFVGEEIYGGDPVQRGSENHALHQIYEKGVRYGSFCMAFYSVSCAIFSFFLNTLIKRFNTKSVYLFSHLIYSLGMLVLALTKSSVVAAITSISAGIMYSSLFTIPFILIANYHSSESFELLSNGQQQGNNDKVAQMKRGLGTDLSMISSMVFVAQFSLSLFMGFIMKLTGTKTVVIYTASILASCAALSSSKLLYFD